MEDRVTAEKIAKALRVSTRVIYDKDWPYVEEKGRGRGGKHRLYPLETLPSDVRAALGRVAASEAAAAGRMADWLDRQVSKTVLGQTGTTDTGTRVGTADAHEHVRQDIEEADAGQLAATLNRCLVRPMVDLNLGPRKLYPRLIIRRPDNEDVGALVDNVVKLLPFGLRVEESVMHDKLGLPDPPADAVLLHAPGQGTAADPTQPNPEEPPQGRQAAASRRAVTATPQAVPERVMDAVDVAVAEELDGWQELVDPLLSPVRTLLQECLDQGLTLEEFQAHLAGLLAGQDTASLTEHLARMTFAARLGGETGATGGK